MDRLLEPLQVQLGSRSLTRPGTLLRQQIHIRGSVRRDEVQAGWLQVEYSDVGWGHAAPI
jgi:hypothetical protein